MRNVTDTWPSLRLILHLAPWDWRMRGFMDIEEGSMDEPEPLDRIAGWWGFNMQVGPLEIDYGHNRPAFMWEKPSGAAS